MQLCPFPWACFFPGSPVDGRNPCCGAVLFPSDYAAEETWESRLYVTPGCDLWDLPDLSSGHASHKLSHIGNWIPETKFPLLCWGEALCHQADGFIPALALRQRNKAGRGIGPTLVPAWHSDMVTTLASCSRTRTLRGTRSTIFLHHCSDLVCKVCTVSDSLLSLWFAGWEWTVPSDGHLLGALGTAPPSLSRCAGLVGSPSPVVYLPYRALTVVVVTYGHLWRALADSKAGHWAAGCPSCLPPSQPALPGSWFCSP